MWKPPSERMVGNTDEAYAVGVAGQLCPCGPSLGQRRLQVPRTPVSGQSQHRRLLAQVDRLKVADDPLSNLGRHMRRRWGPPPYLPTLGRPYGGSKGALVANFVDTNTPHRFCAAAAIRCPPIDPVKRSVRTLPTSTHRTACRNLRSKRRERAAATSATPMARGLDVSHLRFERFRIRPRL